MSTVPIRCYSSFVCYKTTSTKHHLTVSLGHTLYLILLLDGIAASTKQVLLSQCDGANHCTNRACAACSIHIELMQQKLTLHASTTASIANEIDILRCPVFMSLSSMSLISSLNSG